MAFSTSLIVLLQSVILIQAYILKSSFFTELLKKKLSESFQPRLAFGESTSINSHPYYASLRFCGATIISDRWLVTAAHCVSGRKVRLGKAYVGGENIHNSDLVYYDKVILHPHYCTINGVLFNDIALLRLVEPLNFTDSIQPLNLPDVEHNTNGQYAKRMIPSDYFFSHDDSYEYTSMKKRFLHDNYKIAYSKYDPEDYYSEYHYDDDNEDDSSESIEHHYKNVDDSSDSSEHHYDEHNEDHPSESSEHHYNDDENHSSESHEHHYDDDEDHSSESDEHQYEESNEDHSSESNEHHDDDDKNHSSESHEHHYDDDKDHSSEYEESNEDHSSESSEHHYDDDSENHSSESSEHHYDDDEDHSSESSEHYYDEYDEEHSAEDNENYDDEDESIDNNSHVLVSGGLDHTGYLADLSTVNINIFPTSMCMGYYYPGKMWKVPQLTTLDRTSMCGVRVERIPGPGTGDGGSPLVKNNVLVGIVSSPIRNGEVRTKWHSETAIFMNAASYVPWIKSTISIYDCDK